MARCRSSKTRMTTGTHGAGIGTALLAITLTARRAMAGTIQTQATCLEEFGWMDNSLEQPPCIIAAFLLGQCTDGNWDVPAIPDAEHHYSTPNATTQNSCQCSWSAYNLMQACADCQGENFESAMQTWASWTQSCSSTSLTNTSFYPSNAIIPNETAIPFWATMDPTTWADGIFDPSAAQALANEDKPDITQSTRSASTSSASSGGKKSDTGAIVGGVVGGVAALALLGLLACVLVRRNRRRSGYTGTGIILSRHQRSTSDFTSRPSGATQSKYYDAVGGVGMGPSPSPGPTLPFSNESANGSSYDYAYGRAPLVGPAPSGGGFGSYPTLTGTAADANKGQYPMVALNASNPTLSSVGPAYPPPPGMGMTGVMNASMGVGAGAGMGMPPAGAAQAAIPGGHAHTLSGQSTVSHSAYSDTREGAISPYFLPPVGAGTAPEPMAPEDENTATSPGGAGGGASVQGHGGIKGGSRGSSTDLFTTAGRRPDRERLNPPAYSPEPAEPGSTGFGTSGDTDADGSVVGASATPSDSMDAQPALSGTTFLPGSSRAAVAGGSSQAAGSESGARMGLSVVERDAHGYPVDRKRPL